MEFLIKVGFQGFIVEHRSSFSSWIRFCQHGSLIAATVYSLVNYFLFTKAREVPEDYRRGLSQQSELRTKNPTISQSHHASSAINFVWSDILRSFLLAVLINIVLLGQWFQPGTFLHDSGWREKYAVTILMKFSVSLPSYHLWISGVWKWLQQNTFIRSDVSCQVLVINLIPFFYATFLDANRIYQKAKICCNSVEIDINWFKVSEVCPGNVFIKQPFCSNCQSSELS